MNKPIVHVFRYGAPDKFMRWTDGSYDVSAHDNVNLVDLNDEAIFNMVKSNEFILPADEGDIKVANELIGIDQKYILLPQLKDGTIIEYDAYVPKHSIIYRQLSIYTDFRYMFFSVMNIGDFLNKWTPESLNNLKSGVAIKSTTGSGSRGVIILDKKRAKYGGSFTTKITQSQYDKFISFCKKENCKIMLQNLIPMRDDLKKINVDFVIRNGRLLGYIWTVPNQTQLQTNWDNGYMTRTGYTDFMMDQLIDYLVNQCGIENAIMNFEAFSNMHDEMILVEFNWRYSNSMFQAEAFGIDLVGQYLKNKYFKIPIGNHEFCRHWRCDLYDSDPIYHNGI